MWEIEKMVNGDGCARHAWDKEHLGIKEPYKPFPSVFGAVDKAMRHATDGRTVSDVMGTGADSSGLSDGVFRQIPGRMEATVELDSGRQFIIRGTLDTVIEHSDGSVTVVDFKHRPVGSTESMAKAADGYRGQLESYAMLLKRKGTQVRGAAILWLGPNSDNLDDVANAGDGRMSMDYELMASPVAIDENRYWNTLDRYGELMDGDRPPLSDDCDTCTYHRAVSSDGSR